MVKSNGGIIGPDNVTTGGFSGVASGVFKLGEVTDLIRESKWPEVSPFTNTVPNSCRFNIASSDNLTRTSDSGNKKTFTMSFWVKRSTFGTDQVLTNITAPSGAQGRVFFEGNTEQLEFHDVSSGGSYEIRYITNRLFRDVSAWYNIVIAVDTTDGTAGDRVKIYVNGVQETSFATATQPSSGLVTSFNSGGVMEIGSQQVPAEFFGGYMSEVINVDGSQLAPTSFGEFNSGSGIWIPKTITGLTFGANGYYLKFTNASALGEDFSGNDNDFTVNNLTSLDQSTDSPSNNFCTIINASSASKAYTLLEGNLKVTASANNWYGVPRGSIGVSSGKWYYEIKVTDENDNFMVGYMSASNLADVGDRQTNGFPKLNGFQSSGYVKRQDDTEVNISGSFQWNDGDIAQIALDMDNKKLWIGKNGSYYNSGNPATGSNETIGSSYFTAGEAYLPALIFFETNDGSFNFGSPPYAISSGNTDGNGFGNFEYALPSGYLSLNTKNLAAVLG